MQYLSELSSKGILRASGPLKGTPLRAGFLIMSAPSLQEVEDVVAHDPFAIESLIAELTITEWNPIIGIFSAESESDVENLLAKNSID